MKEHLELGITERFGKLVEKVRSEKVKRPKDEADVGEKKKNVIEWALKSATTRIVLARNVGELSDQLKEVATDLSAGKDPEKVDSLRAAVMLKVGEVVENEELAKAQTYVDDLIKNGDIQGAVDWLRKMSQKDTLKVEAKKQKEVDDLLDAVVELDKEKGPEDVVMQKIEKVDKRGREIKKSFENENNEIINTDKKIESEIARKFVEGETKKTAPKPKAVGKVESKPADVKVIAKQAEKAITGDDKSVEADQKFIKKILTGGRTGFGTIDAAGNLVIEVDKFEHIGAQLLYARTSTVLGRNRAELLKPENKELRDYLENLQFELRERLMELEDVDREKRVAQTLVPGEVEWDNLDPTIKATVMHNADFINKHGSAEELLQHAQEEYARKGMAGGFRTRAEQSLQELMLERPDQAVNFNEKGEWVGTAEEFFELCRLEIYKIRDSVPEDRLGNLVFEETAQKYLALMSISTKNNPELKQMKDAVTKTLYLEFVVKSLWKAGGNHEAWQRAAGLILREGGDTNFFLTMKVREKLRGVDKSGNQLVMPGFNVNDMLTVGELKAPNGQSWLAYISTDNIAVNEERLQELGNGLAKHTLEKAKLRKKKDGSPELSAEDYARYLNLLNKNEIKFDKEQLDWVRNYMQYIHTATLNVGEKLWLMTGKKPGDKGFEYASLPGGQFAEKSGLWPQLYFAKYGVTKYGFEQLGKLHIPNPGLLSYARKETLRHFIAVKGNEDWLKDESGEIHKPGSGATDFFFKGHDIGASKMKKFTNFWEEVWFDSRTGDSVKSRGMRSLQNSRDIGRKLISEGKHKEFVGEMEFSQLERLMGHEIPGSTNEDKLTWVVENLDYDMLEMSSMPSKREGDWVNKYSKYYVETVTLFQNFLDAPTLANKMKIIESVLKYNSAAVGNLSTELDGFMDSTRKMGLGLKEGGNPLNPAHWAGPEVASDNQNDLMRSADGDQIEMPMVQKSATDGWYLGRGLKFTTQQYKEGKNDPMVMRKVEIQNAIAWGIVSPQEGGKMMRDWQKMIYFGDTIKKFEFGTDKDGKPREFNLRWGHIVPLLPYFLVRGWWVDRMGMDWEDFKLITSKQNDETWAKLKKLMGIEI